METQGGRSCGELQMRRHVGHVGRNCWRVIHVETRRSCWEELLESDTCGDTTVMWGGIIGSHISKVLEYTMKRVMCIIK